MKNYVHWVTGAWIAALLFFQPASACSVIDHRVIFWGDGTADTFYRPAQFYAQNVHRYNTYGIFNAVIFTVWRDCPCVTSDTIQFKNINCDDQNECTWDQCQKGVCLNQNAAINADSTALEWWKRNCCKCR